MARDRNFKPLVLEEIRTAADSIETAANTRLAVRLVALNKPEEAIAASVERAKRATKDKGKAIRPETFWLPNG